MIEVEGYDRSTVSQHSLGSHHLDICFDKETRSIISAIQNVHTTLYRKGFQADDIICDAHIREGRYVTASTVMGRKCSASALGRTRQEI